MLHLAQHFESDGGMNHCNFLLAASNFKIFSQNISRLMLFSSKPNFRRAHQFSFSVNKIKEIIVFTLEKSLPSSLSHGIFFQFARLKLVLLKGHIRREFIDIIFFMFGAGH